MNSRLIDAIRDCGLTFVRKHEAAAPFELYEAAHKVGQMAFGQYLLLPMSFEQLMEISEDSAVYAQFEEQVLSPFYFQLKGDWGWNLYMCLILHESDLQRIPVQRIAQIERGKKYGKKMILSWSELTERLPAAKLPSRISDNAVADPYEEWGLKLAPLNLEFCLDEYREANFKAFIEQENKPRNIRPDVRNVPSESFRRPTGPIKSLQFGSSYRPHLLSGAPELDFAQINLIYGPNGMGKTSILECIELSFTGTIQRNVLSDASEKENWDGSLIFANDEGSFESTPEEPERKVRETAYYKHKAALTGRSQINRLFHQYNYFSSEAVHQFCFNPNARKNYRNDFARVIYGEQLERIERAWTQYRDEFVKSGKHFHKKLNELRDELKSIRNQDFHDSTLMRQRALSSIQNMNKWISACHYAYPTLGEEASIREIDGWLQHLTPKLNELDIISQPLFDESISEMDDEIALHTAIENIQNNQREYARKREEVLQHLQQLPDTEELLQRSNVELHRREQLKDRHDRYTQLAEFVYHHRSIYDQSHLRNRRKEIQKYKQQLLIAASSLQTIQAKYSHLAEVKMTITDLHQAEEELNQLKTYYKESEQLFYEAADRVEKQKKQIGESQRLASELKNAGKQYLHENPEAAHCPLCGHDHEKQDILLAAIERGLAADDSFMTMLLEEKEAKRVTMLHYKQTADELTDQVKIYKQFQDAYEFFTVQQDIVGISISTPFHPDRVYRFLSNISTRLAETKADSRRIESEILNLEQQGFTLTTIQHLEQLLQDPSLNNVRSQIETRRTSEHLISLIQMEMDRCQDEIDVTVTHIAALEQQIYQTEQEKEIYNQQLLQFEQLFRESSGQFTRLNRAAEALVRLRKHNMLIHDKTSWKEWRSYLAQLSAESDMLRNVLEPAVLIEHSAHKAAEIEEEMARLTVRKNRCEEAVTALNSLRTLAEYGEDFVRANFEAISRLFVALHHPNEFASLELTDDNQIMARRKGQEQGCAVYQMSTGQRTAVILAIFFVMHLVMETAPKFLMLDEPVANMDELNVLGLLDFLRQLAVTRRTQIFFTTANPQVATLFRRKFSFFKEEFRAYHFQRYLEGPLDIQMQQFEPQMEKPINTIRL